MATQQKMTREIRRRRRDISSPRKRVRHPRVEAARERKVPEEIQLEDCFQ